MKKSTSDIVDSKSIGIIILSHGPMALGIKESAEFILGSVDNIAAFALEPDDTPEDFREAFLTEEERYPQGCIFFTDIFGGTPTNQLLNTAVEKKEKIFGFAGVSLPMVLEAVAQRGNVRDLEELMGQLDGISKEAVCNLTEFLEG